MARLFGRRFFRVPRRIVVHGVAGPVDTPAPGAFERKPPPPIPSEPTRRQVKPLPLLGVRRPGAPLVPIAKMLMERHRKIMRFRMAQKPIPTVPIPVVVGSVPILARFQQRALPVAVAARLRAVVRGRTEGATLFPPKPITRPRLPAVRVQRPPVIRGVVAVPPAVGRTPVRTRQPLHRALARLPVPKPQVPLLGIRQPGMIPSRVRQPAAKQPRHQRALRPSMPGSLFIPGGMVFFVRPPRAIRPRHLFRLARFIITAPPAPFTPTEVVTVGPWSAAIIFNAGDCLLIIADGPAKDDPNIRVNINLTPQ